MLFNKENSPLIWKHLIYFKYMKKKKENCPFNVCLYTMWILHSDASKSTLERDWECHRIQWKITCLCHGNVTPLGGGWKIPSGCGQDWTRNHWQHGRHLATAFPYPVHTATTKTSDSSFFSTSNFWVILKCTFLLSLCWKAWWRFNYQEDNTRDCRECTAICSHTKWMGVTCSLLSGSCTTKPSTPLADTHGSKYFFSYSESPNIIQDFQNLGKHSIRMQMSTILKPRLWATCGKS